MIDFTPKPRNFFEEFIQSYYTECVKRFPKIEAITGKWNYEDLIPGLSDFDVRFICSDDMTDEDWCEMSSTVGEVHLELCKNHPEWARVLEHLPGVNPTWQEFGDEFLYYTEYRQWTFYHCKNIEEQKVAEEKLSQRAWDIRDEYYFIKKFLTFYGPYKRGIDPPINLGPYENKYPLHSRMMHYFTPPLQAAVSIILKRVIKGKFETLRLAYNLFPDLKDVLEEIFDTIDKHYEVPRLYEEPGLSKLENSLYTALQVVKDRLKEHITLIPEEKIDNIALWKETIAEASISPLLKVYDSSRFSRLFKGRMYFYVNAPAHFDNIWLIQNELGRVGEMFYRTPYRIFWEVVNGERIDNPDLIVPKLVPSTLTKEQAEATLEFSQLASGTWKKGTEIELSKKIANIFDDFFIGLNNIKRKIEESVRYNR